MAVYSYDDYLKKRDALGFAEGDISDADYALAKKNPDAGISLLTYKNDFKNASSDTARALAHANAEDIRTRYGGYSGGEDGGGFALTPSSEVYESRWDGAIKDGMERLRNARFDYDPNTDENAKAYRDMYVREGERAMRDTLGEVAARTGGNASSYATAAATQANGYYMQQLADKYAELYEAAYNRFYEDYQRTASEVSLLQGLDDSDYSRYLQQKELDLQKESNRAASEQQAFENLLAEKQFALSREQSEGELAYKNYAAYLDSLGDKADIAIGLGDTETLRAMGFDTGMMDASIAEQKLQSAVGLVAKGYSAENLLAMGYSADIIAAAFRSVALAEEELPIDEYTAENNVANPIGYGNLGNAYFTYAQELLQEEAKNR